MCLQDSYWLPSSSVEKNFVNYKELLTTLYLSSGFGWQWLATNLLCTLAYFHCLLVRKVRGGGIFRVAEAREALANCRILFYIPFVRDFHFKWQMFLLNKWYFVLIRVFGCLSDKSLCLSGEDLTDNNRLPLAPADGSSPNSLPAEQQNTPNSSGVAPAVAGRTPSNSAAPASRGMPSKLCLTKLLFQLLLVSSNFRWSLHTFTF